MLEKIQAILKNQGTLLIGMKEGTNEGLKESSSNKDEIKYISEYTQDEFEAILQKYFKIEFFSKVIYSENYVFMTWLCTKTHSEP